MMLSMWKGHQYYVVYVEMLLVTSMMLSMWTNMMLSMWKGCQYNVVYVEGYQYDVVYVEGYQYDVVYVERLPV